MAESNVIREFLVALGFKSDEKALQKFEEGISKATKAVVTLAAAIEVTAVAVAAGVERMASNLEALYFASLRTGSSATNLKAFARAAQDFGASASEAAGSVEGLQRFLRNNPSGAGYLDRLLHQVGRSAFDANGHINDTTTNLAALGELFAKNTANGNGFLNTQYAGILGIDEKTMLAIQNGDFQRDLEDIRKRLGRAGFKEATEQAHSFMKQLRILGDQLLIFGVRVVTVLEQKFRISLGTVTQWFERNGDRLADKVAGVIGHIWDDFNRFLEWLGQHGPQIAKILEDIGTEFKSVYEMLKPAVEWLWDKFKALNDATDGWAAKLAVTLVVLKAIGATSIIGGIVSLTAAIINLGVGIAGLTAGAAATAGGAAAAGGAAGATGLLGLLGPALGLTGAVGGGLGLGWAINKFFPDGPLARFGNAIGDWIYNKKNPTHFAYETLKSLGASPAQAEAMVKVFTVESGLNPYAVGDNGHAFGIGQWHEDRQADYKRIFGREMWEAPSLEDQIKFSMTEHDAGAQAALMAMRMEKNPEAMVKDYVTMAERPADPDEEIMKANRISITQDIAIHVNASDTPHATAEAIRDEIRRNNAEMFRNLVTPVL